MEVNLDTEAINKSITDAIVRSVLGTTIVSQVEVEIKRLSSGYDTPIKKIVQGELRKIIQEIICDRAAQIRETVKAQLSDKFMDQIISKMVEDLHTKRF